MLDYPQLLISETDSGLTNQKISKSEARSRTVTWRLITKNTQFLSQNLSLASIHAMDQTQTSVLGISVSSSPSNLIAQASRIPGICPPLPPTQPAAEILLSHPNLRGTGKKQISLRPLRSNSSERVISTQYFQFHTSHSGILLSVRGYHTTRKKKHPIQASLPSTFFVCYSRVSSPYP